MAGLLLCLLLAGCGAGNHRLDPLILKGAEEVVHIPVEEHSELAGFMKKALRETGLRECTLERKEAEKRERKAVKEIPPRREKNPVAWPLSFCEEGEKSAYAGYISPAAKKKAEKWFRKRLDTYPDGTKIEFYDVDDASWIGRMRSGGEPGVVVVTVGEPPKLNKRVVEEALEKNIPETLRQEMAKDPSGSM